MCFSLPPTITNPARHVLACDLDGTLLTSAKCMHPKNATALIKAIDNGLTFLPATGKSPSGAFRAMGSLGDYLLNRHFTKGVFLNGLLVCADHNEVIYERLLKHPEIVLCQARRYGLLPMFYSHDTVFVENRCALSDIFISSHEPIPTPVGRLDTILSNKLHKALLLDPLNNIATHRKVLEQSLKGFATITQARHDVLEVLPEGLNKGTGLGVLLDHLGIEFDNVVAVGDHENDIEMINKVGFGIAVGNAVKGVREIADAVVCDCDQGAIEQVLKNFVHY